MSELRDVLERADRAARVVVLPPDGFERLMRHRDRKRRNQRIGSAVIALILAAAAIGGAIRAFNGGERRRPAGPPKITPSNLSNVRVQWRVPAAGAGNQPILSGGTVFETPDTWHAKHPAGMLEAIPASCAGGGACRPLWSASTPEPLATPTVEGGVVYVGGSRHVYAFSASCGSADATCRPIWRAPVPGFGTNPDSPPVLEGGVVYLPSNRGVYAFSTTCAHGGATCLPLRTYPTGEHPISRLAVANGTVYAGAAVGSDANGAGRLYAFKASCGSSTCDPLWTLQLRHPVFALRVADGVLLVGTWAHVSGYALNCSSVHGCRPLWTGDIVGPAIGSAVEGDTLYVQDQASGLYAFPITCGAGDNACAPRWSATGFYSGGLSSAPPAVANGLVYVAGTDGTLYAFTASCSGTCQPIGTVDTRGGSKDFVYVNATDRMIFTAGRHSLKGYGLAADRPHPSASP